MKKYSIILYQTEKEGRAQLQIAMIIIEYRIVEWKYF